MPPIAATENTWLRTMIDSVPSLVSYVDLHHVYLVVSVGYSRLLGRAMSDIVGRPMREVLGEEIYAELLPHLQAAAQGRTERFRKTRVREGRERHYEVSFIPHLADGGEVLGLVGFVNDITAHVVEHRKLLELVHDMEQFTALASHDLQEPLRMVVHYLGLLSRRYADSLDDRARQYVAEGVDGAKRMQAMIRALLEYAHIDHQPVAASPTDLRAAVDESLKNLAHLVAETGASILVGPLPRVRGDHGQFVRVFQNLIGNAIKYRNAERRPIIHIFARQSGGDTVVSVRDNGIGIPAADQERIFALFQRLHGRDAYPGFGIGLAICKKIVERSGGRLWVESREGAGAEFRLALPAIGP